MELPAERKFKTSQRVAAHPTWALIKSLGALSDVCVKTQLLSRGSSTTTAKKTLPLCTSTSSLTIPSEAWRHCTCSRKRAATTGYFGCMELLLPPRPFGAAPSSPGCSLLFYAAMRAMVQVRQPRTLLSTSWTCGTTLHRLVRPSSLLVDSSGRLCLSSRRSLCCLSLLCTSVHASLVGVATLRAAGVEGLRVHASRCACTGLFTYSLTQATVDVPCSQVVEMLGFFSSALSGLVWFGFLFPFPVCFLLSLGVLCVSLFP